MKEIQDHYFHLAKKEGYVARSVYKLKEIQDKYKLIRKGQRILDIGSSPGSWIQLLLKLVGENGHIYGIDLKALSIPRSTNLTFLQRYIDSLSEEEIEQTFPKLDGVVSDIAPSTTGDKTHDHYMSIELARSSLRFVRLKLKKDGFFICKVFMGEEYKELMEETKLLFSKVKSFNPKASRSESVETYLMGFDRR